MSTLTGLQLNLYTAGMLTRQHLIARKYYRQTEEERQNMLTGLLNVFNTTFETATTIEFPSDSETDNPSTAICTRDDVILLGSKLSVLSFLYAYSISLHARSDFSEAYYDGVTPMTVAEWAHTVFFIASPQMYIKARDEHLFMHEDIMLCAPFVAFDDDVVPGDQVLKDRYYKHFDMFVKHIIDGDVSAIELDDLFIIAEGHTSLTQHINTVVQQQAS